MQTQDWSSVAPPSLASSRRRRHEEEDEQMFYLPPFLAGPPPNVIIGQNLAAASPLSVAAHSISTPSVTVPSVSTPSVSIPSVSTPSVSIPSVSTPSVSIPSVSTPSVSIPSVMTPSTSVPTVSIPTVSIPTVVTENLGSGASDVPIAVASPLPTSPPAPIPHLRSPSLKSIPLPPTEKIDDSTNEERIDQLKLLGFTDGLAHALAETSLVFPLRIWIVDNSGSMSATDGYRIIESSSSSATANRGFLRSSLTRRNKSSHIMNVVPCTRWEEMRETVEFHAQLAAALNSPTVFRMLNDPGRHVGPQQFGVADKGKQSLLSDDVQLVRRLMRKTPTVGSTPLTRHLREIRATLESMTPTLTKDRRKVVLVLATDGIPTNEHGDASNHSMNEFAAILKSLEELPVWVVVRLCTDEEHVVEYYNGIDSQLERSVEVLDDFITESLEISQFNPWINYTLPLHRCREMGFQHRLLDLMDERPFTIGEMYDYCCLLFGDQKFRSIPDPASNFHLFLKGLAKIVPQERYQWNAVTKKMAPWIDVKELKRHYAGKS